MRQEAHGDARTGDGDGRWGVRGELRALLELLGLGALAVTQPVLGVFADGADVFLTQRASTLDVLLFTVVVAVGPAVGLWLLGLAAGALGARPRRLVHLASLGLLAGVAVVQLVKEVADPPGAVVLALAAAVALVVVLLLVRLSPARLWLRLLSAATVVFVATFLLSPSVRPLLGEEGDGGRGGAVGRPAPVVFVVMDELPTMSLLDGEGGIDGDLFPNFARLAGGSTWYRNHTTTATSTYEAVPAMVSGTYAAEEAPLPTAGVYPDTLFSLLGDDYDVEVREVITRLCPDRVCRSVDRRATTLEVQRSLLDSAWEVLVDRLRPSGTPDAGFTVQPLPFEADPAGRLEQFTAGLGPSEGRPRLDFLHVLLPHQPYNFLPSGKHYDSPDLPEGQFALAWLTEATAEAARQRHLLQLQLADRELGRLLDRLQDLGTYDDTLVVLTSDHGVAFTPDQPMRTLNEATYPELLWTPLFVKAPGQQAGRLVDDHVRSVDVLPTIAELLDVELPYEVDGRPASEATGESTEVRALEGHGGVSQPAEASYREFDLEAGYRTVLASAAAPGGPPGDPLRLHRQGEHGGLVGSPSGPLRRPGAAGVEAELDGATTIRYDPDGRTAQVYVAGSLTGDGGDQPVVAVGVGGRVAAVATMVPDNPRFWAVLPESLLAPGANRLELFLVEGPPGAEALRPLPVRGAA